MPDLLLELFCEEIPARMQAQAAGDLQRLVTSGLVERGLTYEGATAYATPRRLALTVAGLPARQPDTREERKGPRVGAPEKAVEGFLKSAGLSSIDQAQVLADPKGKGEFYVAIIERKGANTIDVLAEILPAIVRAFPWPKSMRWGEASTTTESLRWVRPLHSILAAFGSETEQPEIVRFKVDGVVSGDTTFGHRFMAPGKFRAMRFDDYVPALEKAKVVLDPARRRDIILHDAKNLAHAQGLELVEDDALLYEVAGLVEWPVVLMGEFEKEFLAIPPEVIRATIRANQKCFVLREPSFEAGPADAPHPKETHSAVSQHSGQEKLANKFLLVSNIEARDGGKAIAAGNARVVRARLSDALYFWRTDQADLPDYVNDGNRGRPLDQRMDKLRALNIVFHEKLGTQAERVERIKALARELAPIVGADPEKAERAAELCKADLVTEVVGEFPETQGLMGRYYAAIQGEDAAVCAALEDHYKPQGPTDRIPADPVAIAVALADKLDTLVGFWAIDEKPTGSKDPYALRRAALGVIRIVLENAVQLKLNEFIEEWYWVVCRPEEYKDIRSSNPVAAFFREKGWDTHVLPDGKQVKQYYRTIQKRSELSWASMLPIHLWKEGNASLEQLLSDAENKRLVLPPTRDLQFDLLAFFHDRLKIYLRDKGARHDLIDAALGAASTLPLVGRVGAAAGSDGVGGGAASPPLPIPPSQGGRESGNASSRKIADFSDQADAQQNDDLLMIVRRVDALGRFLATDDGRNLLAGYKRAANIVRAEQRKEKDAGAFNQAYAPGADAPEAEDALAAAVEKSAQEAANAIAEEDFEAAMTALSHLRAPVDKFFDDVTVNDADANKRLNRLRLLNALRAAVHTVADFSKIAG